MTSRPPRLRTLGVALALATTAAIGCKSTKAEATDPPAPAIGVPVCDEYLAALYACMPKMTPEERQAQQQLVDENLAGWRALSVKPSNRASLEESCTGSLADLRATAPCNTR